MAKAKKQSEPKVEDYNQEYTQKCVRLGDMLYKKIKMDMAINQIIKDIQELDKLALEQQKNKEGENKNG